MKDYDDIFKQRLEGYEMKLPSSDRDDFLNRKATRERYARRRRNILGLAVGLPAAAAILCSVLLTIHILSRPDSLTKVGGIDPSALGLPSTYNGLEIRYSIDYILLEMYQNHSSEVFFLPVSAGDTITGIISRYIDSEYLPFKGVYVDEFDPYGRVVQQTLTNQDGIFAFAIKDPKDSILIHADGYESIKFEPFRLSGQIGSILLGKTDEVYMVVQVQPEFPGGQQAMRNYISNNLVYPVQAVKDGIKGRVLVSFIVEKDGSITNPEIVKSVHPLLDAEALRLVTNMPKWTPGIHLGFPRRVKYTIPVNFRLDHITNQDPVVTGNDSVTEDIMASTDDVLF